MGCQHNLSVEAKTMVIPSNQVIYRKRIGTSGGKAVLGIGLCGGLHLVALMKDGGGFETLGAGSHPAVARYLAQRNAPELKYDLLMKSSEPTYADFADLFPEWERVTQELRKIQGL